MNPLQLTASPDQLARAGFEDYIDQRDTLWHVLTYREQGLIRAIEIDNLAARNEFVANLLKTKVVSKLFLPERVGIELLRIKVCDTFIARVRHEIAGYDTKPKVEPITVVKTGIERYRENLIGSPS